MNLYETIRRIVRQEMRSAHTAELAVVQENHPHASDDDTDNYACTVELRNSGVVLKHVPVATSRAGLVSIPAVGDLVLIQFIGGDINAPIITGSLYNDEDRPPVNEDGQTVLHLPLGAGDADAVHIELFSGDKREINVVLGNGLVLQLHDDDPVVVIDVDGGKATIQVDRDGTMSVESRGDITLKGNAITVEAQGDLTLKGATVNIN